MKGKWSRGEKWGAGAVAVAILAIVASFFVPEVRRFIGLEKPVPASAVISNPGPAQKPPTPPPTIAVESNSKVSQHAKIKIAGRKNVAGNVVTGQGNVVGNNNQTNSPSAPGVQFNSAPNGIAIGGGNVTNPTVNNFGPPPITVTWKANDAPSLRPEYRYMKDVVVSVSATWQPVSLGVICDSEIGMVFANFASGGAFSNDREGVEVNNHKIGYVYFKTQPLTSDEPLHIYVFSNQPLSILDVRQATIN